jgi:hypothetical protein
MEYPHFFVKFPAMPSLINFAVYDGDIYILDPREDKLIITIFDKNGKTKDRIEIVFQKLKVPESVKLKLIAEKKKSSGAVWAQIKKSYFVPEYYLIFDNFQIQNGNIYLKTWVEKDESIKFFILDLKGKEKRVLYIPNAKNLYAFHNNNYYFLKDNMESEIWELHLMRL